ncbi:hypothetical protein FI667_g16295, partial [Globisporangium splendens]
MCLWMTIKARLSSGGSRAAQATTSVSPSEAAERPRLGPTTPSLVNVASAKFSSVVPMRLTTERPDRASVPVGFQMLGLEVRSTPAYDDAYQQPKSVSSDAAHRISAKAPSEGTLTVLAAGEEARDAEKRSSEQQKSVQFPSSYAVRDQQELEQVEAQ